MADAAHPKYLTPLLVHTINTRRMQPVLPHRDTRLDRASRHGWGPGTKQVKKKRAASHGDGEPLLLAKNDLPMHALCWQFRQPWRLHKVNFCGMDDAMWLHGQVFLASQSALVHHARPPSSEFPWFLISAHGFGDVYILNPLFQFLHVFLFIFVDKVFFFLVCSVNFWI
jgi:hypothetical protein